MIKRIAIRINFVVMRVIYRILCLLPVKKGIIATSFYGKKYDNNPRYVVEEMHNLLPNIPIYWIVDPKYRIETPSYMKKVRMGYNSLYYYATTMVWIDCHYLPLYVTKRPNQFVVYIDHGGLGMKKSGVDLDLKYRRKARHLSRNSSLFISNSDYISSVYRSSFLYSGPIFECGFPRNDVLFNGQDAINDAVKRVKTYFHISDNTKFVMYAPTHRENSFDLSVYDIDFNALTNCLKLKFGGKWKVLVHMHPAEQKIMGNINLAFNNNQILDADNYPNSQDLILSSEIFISDYSSILFTAAERRIPCFIYAKDYDSFINKREMYFNLDDLPFPVARNNHELFSAIQGFDFSKYLLKWEEFIKKQHLVDNPNSTKAVASVIKNYIEGKIHSSHDLKFDVFS